jgi:hypothetical protein
MCVLMGLMCTGFVMIVKNIAMVLKHFLSSPEEKKRMAAKVKSNNASWENQQFAEKLE